MSSSCMYLSHHNIQLVVVIFHTKLHSMQRRYASRIAHRSLTRKECHARSSERW